jgi:hypothetical protein
MPILAAMRKRETRRVREAAGRSVHDPGNYRQRAHGQAPTPGTSNRRPIRRCSQIGVKARRQHVACPDIVMGRHNQMRQVELRWNGLSEGPFSPARQG